MSLSLRTESPNKFRQVLTIGPHSTFADLGVAGGGGGTAPGAHDFFDASLAACKALTAMRYAQTKGMALEGVELSLERDDSKEGEGLYGLKIQIRFLGPLSQEEKDRIFTVIGRCPVHKLMTSADIQIESTQIP